jgi:uridylate kinase
MNAIVISMGGSVLFSEEISIEYFKKLSLLLNKFKKTYKIFIIIGGGKFSRKYINFCRELGFSEEELDKIGITFTRLNAKILSNFLKSSNQIIPKSINEAIKMKNDIIVMGGTITGHSTDYVGAKLSAKIKASKFIIATNVDGVYDKDPNKYSNAKQFEEIDVKELIKKYGIAWNQAGSNVVIDGPALKLIYDNDIQTFVLNGMKLHELEKAILNVKFKGTIIKNKK